MDKVYSGKKNKTKVAIQWRKKFIGLFGNSVVCHKRQIMLKSGGLLYLGLDLVAKQGRC